MEIFVEFILSVHREMSKSVENCLPTSYSNRPNQANSLKIFWAPVQSINTSLLNALEYSCKTNIFCIVDLVCHHWCLILFYLYFWTDLLSNPCCFDPQWHQAPVWLQVSGRAKAVQRHGRNWQFVHTGCSKQRSFLFVEQGDTDGKNT